MRRSRGGGLTMAERVARSQRPEEECPARHCWVMDSVDGSGVKRAALLVAWRRSVSGDAWEGRVVYLAKLRAGESWALVEEWVPAACLAPD